MSPHFDMILSDFKARESPEAILVVGEDQYLIRVVLSWSCIPIQHTAAEVAYCETWRDVEKWNWLWSCVSYRQVDLAHAVGTGHNLEKALGILVANRILYPDGTVHSYVTRYLRDRVVKLFEAKPRTRSATKKRA